MPLSLSAFLARADAAPLIISHRGDWLSHPENSLDAITSATARGADMVEIDVQTTRDGHLVLLHDETLDRTTEGSGLLADHDLDTVTRLRLREGMGDGSALTEITLPTLGQALDTAQDRVMLNIDTKTQADLDRVCAEVLARGMGDQVLVKGPVDQPSDMMRFLDAPWWGKIAFMPVMLRVPRGGLIETVLTTARAMNLRMVELSFDDEEELRALSGHLRSENVWIWTNTLDPVHSLHYRDSSALEDPKAIWGELLAMGVRAIQTDHSAALARFRGRM
ncbi:glycerophosphodiester phosphodiesterase family protein [Salipiger sp. PrR002]|uniref:glycerophosphodiester phosphodiesterase family protein n=1 Tax=Salipiger sp. PrR002 TaxID=2706489 RepID=UPI0013B66852|nr:glycerophosphodiester phosphodiesterase family protein [Salipiger sp. PrR002]NDW00169.1 glycerophosphodiester phosphodiesterase family protein [Salipiger sp. PrR002]NDW56822.1 glycerophosphodiester phosphodiesterase family protein [Salipiger sp. PrR004]